MPADRRIAGMRVALELAKRGVRGANPLVGAVVIDSSGNILATGYHRGAGTPHAEADALTRLGPIPAEAARKATMLVTLEPCNHVGRTGPCAQAIIDAGIGNVVYAAKDEGSEAAGGAERLRAAGVNVEQGLLESEALDLNHRWFLARAGQRPFTTLHLAQTLDGRIAAADGTSQWITSPASLLHAHQIRSRVDAIVVGTGTVLADDPRLNARDEDGQPFDRQPRRIVMGKREIPEGAALAADANWEQIRSHDPRTVLGRLHESGISHVLIEGGSSIITAFLAEDLIDEIYLYQAPIFLGAGRQSIGDLGVGTLGEARAFRLDPIDGESVQILGTDTLTHLEPMPIRLPARSTAS
ncbi:bifunctional diaminohydroxyphosphoribosylaminopyrimidine deaminase/5-amino-6-(5-phosphoribosylamino)uracil reductase RibD [Paeniglutamicibacter sp. NPDC012692]|uniref:bifunctional diaminohydroxyphosphoribosylaminopyrimidine deaminase/5-amino-6-(5-phosphoribosylamino)uracil reductase RibD n=1 Tax=Paeniglutamicibacter sp. NPDC012692 TaxID=3364388 RepID=UPI0036C81E97